MCSCLLTGIPDRGHVFLLIGLQDLLEPIALLGQQGNLALQTSMLGSCSGNGRGGCPGCGLSLLLLLLQQAYLACNPAAKASGSCSRAVQVLRKTLRAISRSLCNMSESCAISTLNIEFETVQLTDAP